MPLRSANLKRSRDELRNSPCVPPRAAGFAAVTVPPPRRPVVVPPPSRPAASTPSLVRVKITPPTNVVQVEKAAEAATGVETEKAAEAENGVTTEKAAEAAEAGLTAAKDDDSDSDPAHGWVWKRETPDQADSGVEIEKAAKAETDVETEKAAEAVTGVMVAYVGAEKAAEAVTGAMVEFHSPTEQLDSSDASPAEEAAHTTHAIIRDTIQCNMC